MDATTEEEDMAAVNMEIGAMEPDGTVTETRTTTEPERTSQMTGIQEAGGMPEDCLEIGKMAGCTNAAMAWTTITAIRTNVEAKTAALNQEEGRMEPWSTT